MTTDDGAAGASGPPRHYVRTGGGQVVHRAGCFAALGGTPWEWAEGMTAAELASDPTAGRCSSGCGSPTST